MKNTDGRKENDIRYKICRTTLFADTPNSSGRHPAKITKTIKSTTIPVLSNIAPPDLC